MIENVLYLSLNSKFKDVGFMFPDELEINHYSPGFFIIEKRNTLINQEKEFCDEYTFLAVEDGKIEKLLLIADEEYNKHHQSNLFVVDTHKYGELRFEAIYVPSTINRYVGKRYDFENKKNNYFYILKCLDMERLESICNEHKFYFVGYTGNKLG